MKISIIIPVHNEAGSILGVYKELCELDLSPEYEFEIVVVDDCSTDKTPQVLSQIQSESDNIVTIRHGQRLGQSAAIATGVSRTNGPIIVTIDGDGQNVVEDISVLLTHLCPNTACVNGIRSKRNDPCLKVVSSRIANRLRSWLLSDPVIDAGCGLKIIRRDALSGLPYFNGMHRFLPTMLHMQGHLVRQAPIKQRERKSGSSKYGVSDRLWKGILDCLAMIWFRRYCFSHIKISNIPSQFCSNDNSRALNTDQCDPHD